MFYDHAKIEARGGKGGNGCVSFRREKHVAKGGPDGGDGGNGGAVVLAASRRLRDLAEFQRRRLFRAGNGRQGEGSRRHGRSGDDLRIEVPLGTQVFEADSRLVADLVAEGQEFLAAEGGEGGRGNARFASSTRRTPRFAELGLKGAEREYTLELKLLADAGLLGFPNAGKSSLLRRVSRAKPKVADYPFTTTAPMLGTVEEGETGQQFTIADVPGLLEGASEGVGLGDRFLVHLERTSILFHIVDVTGYYERQPLENFRTINRELAGFSPGLASRPQLVALNKIDLLPEDDVEARRRELVGEVESLGREGEAAFAWLLDAAGGDPDSMEAADAVIPVSAATGEGLDILLRRGFGLIREIWDSGESAATGTPAGRTVYRPGADDSWQVSFDGERFRVSGELVEKLVARTDFANEDAVAYLQERLERLGVSEELSKVGARPGEDVVIGDMEFEFW